MAQKPWHLFAGLLGLSLLTACAPTHLAYQKLPLSDMPDLIEIPTSTFYQGSGDGEREVAYRLDESAYQSTITRDQGWYEFELPYQRLRLQRFHITETPITNYQYASFIADTGYDFPDVDAVDWNSYGVSQPYTATEKYIWDEDGYPRGRANHPVVLVSYRDAQAYADWLSQKTGRYWRLPTEEEWELAARGTDGHTFPWGNGYAPAKANTADQGPYNTLPVGSSPDGASPFGVLDMAGQVYEWTRTPGEKGRMTVKGGAWDDRGCGVCRPAARHHRPASMKHILIGFRLVREVAR